MTASMSQCLMQMVQTDYAISDYQSEIAPRWCSGCGDTAILTAMQRLCRDEQLPPEKTVSVSGIGCASRLPHYMNAYGFHGIHGRALPIAEGIKIRRPDLHVFVTMGDGDCCSIGAAHWLHAIRYNMNMTVLLHDNNVYGLTKKQASPTSPHGMKSNTTPFGATLNPLNPLTVTLGVSNVSFVAQAVDWIPDLLYQILRQAYHHKGLSFIRILQRCPNFMEHRFDDWVRDPSKMRILTHGDGLRLAPDLSRVYKNQETHDPLNMERALALAALEGEIPVGILYRNPNVPCYDELRAGERPNTPALVETVLNEEFDKVGIWPDGAAAQVGE
ncbi:thiamine pyrophosphate-dependent enzyme [Tropicimonas sediminicola]|uniref:2-oxoglutarate ferredoxin oxidoreductase subunit beta n=1 Tax=Tropicimonas sediminicola TaxID=1031541 RepID=A0A239JV68_9RHOB|nr:thiamine pyrophosphate-dependent enzyme [Tropicimonas sediminicola]SNT09807.1 2-oxoglutarate ferredoxin oxidoreductase subunit beta [Tropicimonas sediminicola]